MRVLSGVNALRALLTYILNLQLLYIQCQHISGYVSDLGLHY